MIVRLFKTNQNTVFAFIPLAILVLRWPNLIGEAPFTSSGQLPFLSDFFAWLSTHPIISLVLTVAAITYQGYWICVMVTEHRLLPYTSNFPAFVLVICYSVFSPQSWFSPVIFANVFLVLSLNRISNIYPQGEIFGTLFRAGIYIGLASLLYLPSLFMLLILIYDLTIVRSFNWREHIIPFAGLATIYFYLFGYYFVREETVIFFNYFIEPKTFLILTNWNFLNSLPIFLALIFSITAFSYLVVSGHKRTVRINNLFKVITATFVIAFSFSLIYVSDLLSVSALMWPPLSILLSYYLLSVRKNWIREGLVYFLLASIVARDLYSHLL